MVSNSQKMWSLIKKITTQTAEGKISWVSFNPENESFSASIGKGSIIVRSTVSRARANIDDPTVRDYHIFLYDARGNLVDSVDDIELDAELKSEDIFIDPGEVYKDMKKMFDIVYRTTMGVDNLIDSFLDALS